MSCTYENSHFDGSKMIKLVALEEMGQAAPRAQVGVAYCRRVVHAVDGLHTQLRSHTQQ